MLKRRKKTEDKLAEEAYEKNKMQALFFKIWTKRPHNSQLSGTPLGNEPLTTFFDHLLEKKAYPQFKFEEENIILVTATEHDARTKGHPSEKHKEAIERAKQKFLYAEQNKK
jgi:hypothetical protein